MKIHLLICLISFGWAPSILYAKALSSPGSSQDTIGKLERRVDVILNIINSQIEEENLKLESLNEQSSKFESDKKILKDTKNEKSKILKSLQFNYQKRNASLYLLTMIRQLKIQHETTANKQLMEINEALKSLDKNKLPGIQHLNSISSVPYLRNNTAVYDKEISSFCNLTRSPDGKIIANEFENFFEYTDPKISSHFKESDFLECQARFIKTKKDYFLELKFILNSPKASSIYGTIDATNPSKIDFINGDFIYLETFALTSGILDPVTGSTVYNVQYKLNHEDIRNLSKNDIDLITILWTSGTDQFEICKIDLLRNLFECIQKRKLQN